MYSRHGKPRFLCIPGEFLLSRASPRARSSAMFQFRVRIKRPVAAPMGGA
jgi:hypothetical protein